MKLTTCVKVLIAFARTRAASSDKRAIMYGTSRSSFTSSGRCSQRANSTSRAFIFELGNEVLRIKEHTYDKKISVPDSIGVVKSNRKSVLARFYLLL